MLVTPSRSRSRVGRRSPSCFHVAGRKQPRAPSTRSARTPVTASNASGEFSGRATKSLSRGSSCRRKLADVLLGEKALGNHHMRQRGDDRDVGAWLSAANGIRLTCGESTRSSCAINDDQLGAFAQTLRIRDANTDSVGRIRTDDHDPSDCSTDLKVASGRRANVCQGHNLWVMHTRAQVRRCCCRTPRAPASEPNTFLRWCSVTR